MDRKWLLASVCLLPKFSHKRALRTLRCSWQMRELSHLLTCGGVEEWPGRCGGRAVSTFPSRRWIAHAVAIYHWKESRGCCGGGGGVAWLDVQSPCYPLKPKSAPGTSTELPASFSPQTGTYGSLSQRSAGAYYVFVLRFIPFPQPNFHLQQHHRWFLTESKRISTVPLVRK